MDLNRWNKIRYSLYQPFYDAVAGLFAPYRKRSVEMLSIRPESRVLILGAGTGLDLPYLKGCRNITAIDITSSMISALKRRALRLNINVSATVMDGQDLEFPDESFDFVIMHLILAVIPDPYKCIKEAERVLVKGGRGVIFDKFLPDDATPSQARKALNFFSNLFFSDINRKAKDIISASSFRKIEDIPAAMGGMFRIILVEK